jgi:hypothetical protein
VICANRIITAVVRSFLSTIPVQHGLGDADLVGDLIHADVLATLTDRLDRSVDEFVATFHLVLVPTSLPAVGFHRPGRDLLSHYAGPIRSVSLHSKANFR